jgi:MYXO-CTERM domain-containing protein
MNVFKAVFATVALAAIIPAHANLLIDGGFELPAIANGSYITASSIPGWTGTPNIEVQNHVAGSPFEGNQFVELDTDANSSMFQDFATVRGVAYTIHFDYSPRPGVSAASNGIELFWDDTLLAIVAMNGIGLGDTAWTGFDLTTVADGPVSRISFAAFGTSDGLGGYLDDVSVTAIPEPGTVEIFGLGLVMLAMLGGTRRREPAASFGPSF